MKIYMMIIRSYPSIAICDEPPVESGYGRYFFLKIKSKLSELEEVRSPTYSIILLRLLISLTQIKDL